MKNKSLSNEAVLYVALKIAALEAYHTEVVETEMSDLLIGSGKEFPTPDVWIRERVNSWLQEAELKIKKS
jgi:hypothetical protein